MSLFEVIPDEIVIIISSYLGSELLSVCKSLHSLLRYEWLVSRVLLPILIKEVTSHVDDPDTEHLILIDKNINTTIYGGEIHDISFCDLVEWCSMGECDVNECLKIFGCGIDDVIFDYISLSSILNKRFPPETRDDISDVIRKRCDEERQKFLDMRPLMINNVKEFNYHFSYDKVINKIMRQ